ncbi:MotA/TolQ/ExbB proton channel family protein [Inhella crocodyli]|uniref:Biopolymer transport protein ExbB n=1 Tax=Inhella crocodyli TaxID=2499851 RepID=A0A3S2XRN5_9BURK|nr:MotA/TolQ/ExbB proton channel family protein [Inhella crocodyli]RVT83023.1 MotA/TolQ/ExbB proton channel family protein [Inhella crocodyli]
MFSRFSALIATLAVAASLVAAPAFAQSDAASAPAAAEQTAAPAVADAAPADAPKAREASDNPYGLKAMLEHGDMVSKTVLALMVIMSAGSWFIMFTKLWDQHKLGNEAKNVRVSFFKKATLAEGVKSLPEGSAFRYIAQTAVEAGEHHEGALTENIDRNTWVTMNVDRAVSDVNAKMGSGLGFLATVGSTSPFIGLFGTVWGILQALTAIGVAGQASIDKVAGPVGEALIMTAIGLAVAVPAVLGYNWLLNRNKAVMGQVRAFAGDLHGVLMGSRQIKR